jgi:Coenzyme PQQ synthesis protein D (PqqD)
MIDDGTRIVRCEGMITTDVEDETIILNSATGNFVQINGSAGRIWGLLESPHTLVSLCALLSEQYLVSMDQCRAELISFVDDMRAKGLVRLVQD